MFDKLQDLFTNCWKGLYCRTSEMQSLSLCTKTKEKNQTVETIDASLLSVSGKIMARVLLNRLLPTIAQENTPESQRNRRHDLRAEADTGEMQRTEHRSICSFLGSDQGFGTVSRDGPWKSLARLGFPAKFLTNLRQLHGGQNSPVKYEGSLSDSFLISNGVKQRCVLAPTLFSIFFSIMLREAKEDLQDGIYIRFRTDGSLFNLRCLLARTKTIEELIT